MNKRGDLLNGLDDTQRIALTESLTKDSLVLAGAGSGKTRLLTTRLAYLMDVLNVCPSNIVCITFTKKASNEMTDRMKSLTKSEDAHLMWIGTYHSICLKILSQFHEVVGLREGYRILDQYNSRKMIMDIMYNLGYKTQKEEVALIVKQISDYKNDMITPSKLLKQIMEKNDSNEAAVFKDPLYRVYKIYKVYTTQSLRENVIDFDDIVVKAVTAILTSIDAQDFVERQFKYILADEVQDSNTVNVLLLNLLSKNANTFIVGDINQSIYGWRGAKPNLILNFVKNKGMQTLKLEQNYRSTKTIVDASNRLIQNNDIKVPMNCYSNNEDGDKIKYTICNTNNDEAQYVVDCIKDLREKGTKYNDCMILYRVNSQSRALEETLMANSIPYHIQGSLSFFKREEIKDTMAIVKTYSNNTSKDDLKRALMSLKGVGAAATNNILEIFEYRQNAIDSIRAYVPRNASQTQSLNAFLGLLSNEGLTLEQIVDEASKMQKQKYLNKESDEQATKISNLDELVLLASERSKGGESISEFIRYVDLSTNEDVFEDERDKVTLMTIHSSKGLEAKNVFVVGFNNKLIPHAMSSTPEMIEEERRLLYVAMTRAEKKLYMSRYFSDAQRSYDASPFLAEIPKQLIAIDDSLLAQ